MIQRYTRPEMEKVWNDRNKYLVWLKIELAVCEELAKKKVIPPKEWKELKRKCTTLIQDGGVHPREVEKVEKVTRHDVIAFTTAVAKHIGPTSRWVHFGLTSSDILDTALSLQALEAARILEKDIVLLMKSLKKQAKKYKNLPTIGRSHGIYAEPTSFGLKFLGWYTEWSRNLERLRASIKTLGFGQLSGAVGVNAHFDLHFEKRVLARLGLKREWVSTQVIPRDRHAEFLNTLAVCGGTLERMSVELRHLQRSEVSEVLEGFRKGQKGSSAMPHKRNPISAENITGCARLLRSYAQAAMENIALWHERDISHSSVERVIFPDATTVLNYATQRMIQLVDGLVVQKENVKKNLDHAGQTVFSGHYLLALVKKGALREDAYYWVQEAALQSIDLNESMIACLEKHKKIRIYLSVAEIRKLGSMEHQLRNVDQIYSQVLKAKSP